LKILPRAASAPEGGPGTHLSFTVLALSCNIRKKF